MPKGSFESILSGFLKESALVEIPHLRANIQDLLNSASFLGTASCEKVAQLWCGPKGIGKTALLRAMCVAGKLQQLVKAKHPQHRQCKYLTAVYIDLRDPGLELTFSQVVCNGLLQYDGPLPVGFDAQLRALAAEAEGPGSLRISKLNKLLSEREVAVLCVVDEAENLYKQGSFTDDLSKVWVRELLLLTGLGAAPGAKVSIGVVMCCSLARARQLFLLEVGEQRQTFGPEYEWAYRCMNWNGTKFNQMVCAQPSWTRARLLSYVALCLRSADAHEKAGRSQCPMELLLANAMREAAGKGGGAAAAAASGSPAQGGSDTVRQPEAHIEGSAPTEETATTQQHRAVRSSEHGASSSSPMPHESEHSAVSAEEDAVSTVPLLAPAEALHLLLAYTGGNHRAIKTFVEQFAEFLPTFDTASHRFNRDGFVAQLDSLAMTRGWDVAKPLSDEDKQVVCELLALLPDSSMSLDLTMHFDQDKFKVPKGALAAKLREGGLDRAADSGAVFVTRASVALSSPATLFRYMDSGVDFEMLRWMLYPLGAFSERLELPVAQAIARGAKQLLPAECALSSQTTVVQVSQDRGGQALLPFKIGVCSVDAAPHAHFVTTARLLKLAAKLGATPAETKTGKVNRKPAWEAISAKVLELVEAGGGWWGRSCGRRQRRPSQGQGDLGAQRIASCSRRTTTS